MHTNGFMAISGKYVLVTSLVCGALAFFSSEAQAASQPDVFYVAASPSGNDHVSVGAGANTCTSPSEPCATIAHAIAEEGILKHGDSSGTVVSLAKGTYDDADDSMFHDLGPSNDNVTITGAGRATEIEPMSCGALSQSKAGPDASPSVPASESAIVNLDGLHGITIENMTLDGGALRLAGCEDTADYQAGILATGAATNNKLENVTISAGTMYGIQMDDSSQTQMSGDVVHPNLCTSTLRAPARGLGSGWTYDQDITVSKIPKCASGSSGVTINGTSYAATVSSNSTTVVLTGGPTPPATPAIARRATIVFNTSVASYTGVGIACNTLTEPLPVPTSCSISSTTVVGGGTVYTTTNSPIGILVTNGATADLHGNRVSGNTDATANGIGIGLLPDTVDGETAASTTVGVNESTGTGSGETLGDNDISILASAFPSVASSAVWAINNNTISANEVGMLLSGLDTGANIGGVNVSSNSITGTLPGAGMELVDDVGSGGGAITVGGITKALGNTLSGNGIGVAVTEGTSSVLFQNNSVTNNADFGVAVDGADAMPEFLPGLTASDNTFTDNTWTDNGTPSSGELNGGANVIDFGGFSFPSASKSIGGSAEAQADDLTLVSSIPGGTTPSSLTLTKASGSVEIGPGTLINVNGYCAVSTFTCVDTNVSFFVTSVGTSGSLTGVLGNLPVVVNVEPIDPGAAQLLDTVAAGAAVISNEQVQLTTSNLYSGNSCNPTAPNTSTTLKAGTGGGPAGPQGSQTGYEAC
jgi:hypothetical protein